MPESPSLAEMGFRKNQTRGKPRLRSWDTFHGVKFGEERARHGQTIYKAKASSTFMKILQKLARAIVKHGNLIVLESCHGAGVWISSEARPS